MKTDHIYDKNVLDIWDEISYVSFTMGGAWFYTQSHFSPITDGLGVFKVKHVTVRKKEYREDARQGFWMLHAWPRA